VPKPPRKVKLTDLGCIGGLLLSFDQLGARRRNLDLEDRFA